MLKRCVDAFRFLFKHLIQKAFYVNSTHQEAVRRVLPNRRNESLNFAYSGHVFSSEKKKKVLRYLKWYTRLLTIEVQKCAFERLLYQKLYRLSVCMHSWRFTWRFFFWGGGEGEVLLAERIWQTIIWWW